MQYINVVVDNKSEQTDMFFTYLAPDDVQVGSKVTVCFGNRKKQIDGYCVETNINPSFDPSKIKEIDSFDTVRSLNAEMIDTALWMKRRYGVKYFDAIKMFTVDGKREPKNKELRSPLIEYPDYELTSDQKKAVEKIHKSITSEKSNTFLIKGVTNSGKTEVYMRAVEKALELGKTAIILLPEIALSAQVEERFKKRFGEKNVATLHSKLRKSKRLEEWLRIKNGESKIVVGARTSIFAPLDNIGVIVIDEEHESTYKSDHNPKYETVDIAYKRAMYFGATLVLGSATPSVVSYYRAKSGIYNLIEMNSRVGASSMPLLELVDMRSEARAGNFSILSRKLAEEMSHTLKSREQIILFLNRRGFSTQIMCPDCGYIMKCHDCDITLTYHKSNNAAVCHYCGRKYPVPKACPDCGSKFIKYVGAGTEKVVEQVQNLFPESRVDRFDLDTATSTTEIDKVIKRFHKGETDILVGTQILAKGLDFKNVALVGIINADVSLNIPDYRSSERTYQLITQVSGRAGRAGGNSKVIIQTYEPDSDVIIDASNNDYESFYEAELMHRSIMNYPPYSDIISVSVVADRNADIEDALMYANNFRNMLLNMNGLPEGGKILKPREDQRRADDKSRVTFIIKAPSGSRNGYVKAYSDFKEKMKQSNANCFIELDINPYGIV